MRVFVDQERCEGHGQCVAAAPELFGFDDDGVTVVLQDPVAPDCADAASAAVRRCPVAALRAGES